MAITGILLSGISKVGKMDQDGPRWTKMDQDGPRWTKMDQDGPRWTKMGRVVYLHPASPAHLLIFIHHWRK
jgi:hypothetical protein